MRNPKIKAIFLNGKKNEDWKYNRKTGVLEFPYSIPTGTQMEIVYHDQLLRKIQALFRKRGRHHDGT